MGKAIFITGTDTGVGKTLVTGGLAAALVRRGKKVGVMKPAESGCPLKDGKLLPQDALFLKTMAGVNDDLDLICPYSLHLPLAPASAAQAQGIKIDPKKIADCFLKLKKKYELLLVEGAGGLMVPYADKYLSSHLVKRLKLPVLLVIGSRLGAISSALTTLAASKQLKIQLMGGVINDLSTNEKVLDSTRESLHRYFTAPLFGEIPFDLDITQINTPETLADLMEKYLDIDLFWRCLKKYKA